MSHGDDYTYAKTCSGERDSAPEIFLEDEHSKAEKSSGGGDSNGETYSDEGNFAIGTLSDKDDSNTKRSYHKDSDASAESSSNKKDAKVSSRSLSELLSVARKLYPDKHERYIDNQAGKLASRSDEEYALAKISCGLCYIERFNGSVCYHVSVKNLSEDCVFCGILRKCQQHFADDCKKMAIRYNESTNNLQICCRAHHRRNICESNHIQLYSKELCMLQSPFRYARDIHESVGSEVSMNVMKNWISDCCTLHQHVSPTRSLNPTRLIKLGRYEDDGARLYSSEHAVVYAALSYRWGSGKQSETTKDNVTERYQELETSGFPKTLQDAIYITRRLGLEYIWIDRVCIIQDDKEDWAKEASLMADIYASAHVVLSATATEHCEDGFLGKRSKPLVIQNAQCSQETQGLCARQINSHYCLSREPKANYTLYKRGWCMQERFLARRIIHFLPDEILFECQAGRKCECEASNQSKSSHVRDGYSSFGRLQAAKNMEERQFIRNWKEIVERYSNTKLTYGKDSLPALSGIAACVQHLNPGRYIAGLWEKGIGTQLGWYINTNNNPTRRWEDPKDINILGPTFSWSSHVMGPVRHLHNGRGVRSLYTLESFNIELATSNPYGQVRDATICLSGWSVSGYDMISWLKTPATVKHQFFTLYFDSGFAHIYGRGTESATDYTGMEELENTIDWESVMCFGLHEDDYDIDDDIDDERYWVDALLVQPSQTDVRKYARIGVVGCLNRSWFKKTAVARTITLV